VIALAALGLYVLAGRAIDGVTGLVRTVTVGTTGRPVLDSRAVNVIDLAGVDPAAGGESGVVAEWHGYWEVPASGLYDLALDSRGASSWTVDGRLAHQVTSSNSGASRRTVWLDEGFREISVSYAVDPTAPHVAVQAAETGARLKPLSSGALKPRLPRNPALRAGIRVVHRALGWIAIVSGVWAARRSLPLLARRWSGVFSHPARRHVVAKALAWVALAAILGYGALLRLDAIAGRYGPVTSPSWLAAVQTRTVAAPAAIRPASIGWEPELLYPHRDGSLAKYRSDPYTYLDTARNMTWFYAGHPREPVFPFVTRLFLHGLAWQDVAVSFASALFSLLAVWFTYLLGAAVWSRPVGLIAALGLSLDADILSLSSLGWRDDAYMALAVLCAYLALRWWKAGPPGTSAIRVLGRTVDATYLAAAVAGLAGGFAFLTRITAMTFLLPGLVWLFVERRTGWRRQLIAVSVAVILTLLVAGPFFFNCWRVLGDPFYSFNVHGSVYSLAEGRPEYTRGTIGYVSEKFARRPMLMIDTVTQGLTTYPFANKWRGLRPWLEGVDRWASAAAIVGLAVLAASPAGRLLIVMLVGSTIPFAFTWNVDPDYRFTVQAYPFLLVAAGVAVAVVADLVRRVLVPRHLRSETAWWHTPWRPWAATVGLGAVTLFLVWRVSPPLVFTESLRVREDATLAAGGRDGAFFGDGWSPVIPGANVNQRMTANEGELAFRLPEEGEYHATLRMDPFPRPLAGSPPAQLPAVDVLLNGISVATIQLEWTPDRVGMYRVVFPQSAVRRGGNQLILRVRQSPPADGQAVSLWYVRVHPRQTASAIAQRRASPRAVRRPVAGSIQMPSNDPMPQFQALTVWSGRPR
jgi:hypothetical protein